MRPINRSLADKALDDVDHALGRPRNPLTDTYRDHYCVSAGTPLARRMLGSPWWEMDRPINQGRDLILTVTRAGRIALAEYLERLTAEPATSDENISADVDFKDAK